ncbi:MAG TPA: DedA family protein [Rubrobacter sp.]|jgi:membrane protein DedA with SNARE-associated domain|nr:DedA family protein [Rubrobacter sp.]
MGGVLTDLVRWVIDVVHSLGYVGVFVLILAGSVYLPVPTELTLPLFGFLIGNGRLSFVPVLLAATAARVCAALVMYAVGYRLREARLRRVIKHFERSKVLFVSDFDRASAVFEHHGGKAILVGHLIPGVGALVSVPAGLKRMPVRWRFLGYTILGCSIWNASLIGLGWALGGRWRIIEVFTSFVGSAILIILIAATVWFFWRRRKAHR